MNICDFSCLLKVNEKMDIYTKIIIKKVVFRFKTNETN